MGSGWWQADDGLHRPSADKRERREREEEQGRGEFVAHQVSSATGPLAWVAIFWEG